MSECKFKKGDRVRWKDEDLEFEVDHVEYGDTLGPRLWLTDGEYLHAFRCELVATTAAVPQKEPWLLKELRKAKAAVEPPRAFQVGDVVESGASGTSKQYVVTGVSYDHERKLQLLHLDKCDWPCRADVFTLVTPVALAGPEWHRVVRENTPPGMESRTWEEEGFRRFQVSYKGRAGTAWHFHEEWDGLPDGGAHVARSWMQFSAEKLGIPDPYATPTIDGQAAVLPPMPSEPPRFVVGDRIVLRCNGWVGTVTGFDAVNGWIKGRYDNGHHVWGPPKDYDHLVATAEGPSPVDLSLTNEIGFPTMPQARIGGVTTSLPMAAHRIEHPARPVPAWGDVVEWQAFVHGPCKGDHGSHETHRGLVVPTDGNGNKPRSGYLWARRRFEGVTGYECVSVDLVTIVESGAKR